MESFSISINADARIEANLSGLIANSVDFSVINGLLLCFISIRENPSADGVPITLEP